MSRAAATRRRSHLRPTCCSRTANECRLPRSRFAVIFLRPTSRTARVTAYAAVFASMPFSRRARPRIIPVAASTAWSSALAVRLSSSLLHDAASAVLSSSAAASEVSTDGSVSDGVCFTTSSSSCSTTSPKTRASSSSSSSCGSLEFAPTGPATARRVRKPLETRWMCGMAVSSRARTSATGLAGWFCGVRSEAKARSRSCCRDSTQLGLRLCAARAVPRARRWRDTRSARQRRRRVAARRERCSRRAQRSSYESSGRHLSAAK
mmetsp:Transcript_1326/g.3820  ORF Transcript_1326/g.3820 Transcript_1326/m.3820 type:complete len:264 (-) Transcript_1326:101-892(-)